MDVKYTKVMSKKQKVDFFSRQNINPDFDKTEKSVEGCPMQYAIYRILTQTNLT
jgi:hypothetical protein